MRRERREKNFSTAGFARLPLLLLPEGKGIKKMKGLASSQVEKKKKKLQNPGFARPP